MFGFAAICFNFLWAFTYVYGVPIYNIAIGQAIGYRTKREENTEIGFIYRVVFSVVHSH